MMAASDADYLHALRFRWLTPAYDLVVRSLTRERVFKSALIRQADIQPDQLVIDLGCGTGTLAVAIKRQFADVAVIGVDGDADMLSIARRKATVSGVDAQFVAALGQRLPLPDSRADQVLSTLFFHHLVVEDKLAVAREAFRILKPGGLIHVADWGQPSNWLMRLAFLPVQLLDGFDRTSSHVRGQLPEAFVQAGFIQVEERSRVDTGLGTLSLYAAIRPE